VSSSGSKPRVLASAGVGGRRATVVTGIGKGEASLTLARPGARIADSGVPLKKDQWFTFIGVNDKDFTAVGGFLPPGAVSVDVVDAAGIVREAVVGDGAWACVLDSVEERNFDPAVVFKDQTGAVVHRRTTQPTYAERIAQLEADPNFTFVIRSSPPEPSSARLGTLADRASPSDLSKRDAISEVSDDQLVLVRSHAVGDVRVGASKLGGAPDLPAGALWPTTPDGRLLAFLGQIDLGEIPETKLPSALRTGLLSIFCAIDPDQRAAGIEIADDDGCQVRRIDDPELRRVAWPDALDPACRYDEIGVQCVSHADLPDRALGRPDHRLLGSPDSVQQDVLAEVAELPSSTPNGSPDAWCLLLQLDEDPDVGLQWGDGGRLYVCVPVADLQDGSLDHAVAISQSH
jgi:Domain of unknown function (DUF1963)